MNYLGYEIAYEKNYVWTFALTQHLPPLRISLHFVGTRHPLSANVIIECPSAFQQISIVPRKRSVLDE